MATGKNELANTLARFIKDNGVEEAGRIMSQMMLGMAALAKADRIEFRDESGSVIVTHTKLPESAVN